MSASSGQKPMAETQRLKMSNYNSVKTERTQPTRTQPQSKLQSRSPTPVKFGAITPRPVTAYARQQANGASAEQNSPPKTRGTSPSISSVAQLYNNIQIQKDEKNKLEQKIIQLRQDLSCV